MIFAFLKKLKSASIINAVFVLLFVSTLLATGHFLFLNTEVVEAEGSGIEFTDDVILDLDGLDVTVYIATGSKATSLDVGATTLDVYGVPHGAGDFFRLKTDGHTMLDLSSTTGSIDFSISSNDINSSGHLLEWVIDTSTEVDYVVGVADANTDYRIDRNGTEIDASPVSSAAEAELVFSATGTGTYNVYGSAEYCQETNVQGSAWSDNIGWISFSCMNEYKVGEGVNYGVNIDEDTDFLSGHAWSDNIGWITFEKDDLTDCPGESCEARIEDNLLLGWARVVSNGEWISFSNVVGEDEYRVKLVGSYFHGWAWGDTTLGWISFNCENIENECATSDYDVWTTLSIDQDYPVVRTDPALARTEDGKSVTLMGNLLSLGADTNVDVWFMWGETLETIDNRLDVTASPLSSKGSFSAKLEFGSEQFGERLYFKAVAENEHGEASGIVRSFIISKGEGTIIIKYGDKERRIGVGEEGLIEILR